MKKPSKEGDAAAAAAALPTIWPVAREVIPPAVLFVATRRDPTNVVLRTHFIANDSTVLKPPALKSKRMARTTRCE